MAAVLPVAREEEEEEEEEEEASALAGSMPSSTSLAGVRWSWTLLQRL